MKLHYRDNNTDFMMPYDMRMEYLSDGLKGSACGYMRKTTMDKSKVTCKLCIREISKLDN
jgi:hypothetical protein